MTTAVQAASEADFANVNLEVVSEFPAIICLDTITTSSVIEVCVALTETCADGGVAPLPGRDILFFSNQGGCGANEGQVPFAIVATDQDGIACLSFDRLDTLLVADEVSFRVKFNGESKPSNEEPPNSACNLDERVNLSVGNGCAGALIVSGCEDNGVDFDIITGDSADLYFVKTVDLDRDNHTDIIYTGTAAAGLFVSYGESGGTLSAATTYLPVGQAAFDFGYVNADTLLDIVSVLDTTVYVLYNQGNRVFTVDSFSIAASDPSRAASAPGITVGPLNDDLFADMIVSPGIILYGDEAGVFQTREVMSVAVDASASCDFDRNGWNDMVALSGNSIVSFLNDGTGELVQSSVVPINQTQIDFPPIMSTSDFNGDRIADVAVVVPDSANPNQSTLTIISYDEFGFPINVSSISIAGLAYAVTAADVDKDLNIDLVLANGSTSNLEIYKGDGTGSFTGPVLVNLGSESGSAITLAAFDLDRDGNADFVSGGPGGSSLVVALNQQADDPVIVDEMTTTAYSDINITVINPDGFVISEGLTTVAGSDYQTLDVDGDGLLDERTLDYNLQYGEYQIIYELEDDTGLAVDYSSAIGIDGSQRAVVLLGYNDGGVAKSISPSLTFYYRVEPVSSIQPANGIATDLSRPTFDWSILADSIPVAANYHFQLDRYLDFRSPIFDDTTLTIPQYDPPQSLGNDSVFYWHFRTFDGVSWSDYSRTFAAYITGVCCIGSIGNVNMDAGGDVDISDVTTIADFLFGGGELGECPGVGNSNDDPWGHIDVSDLTYLVSYLYDSGPPPPMCP